ncbi:MAG TPA: hypothetical protein VIB47_13180 [Dehalococcoidia bacterium]
MAYARHPIHVKAAAAHRRAPVAEEFGLHAAILLLALAAVIATLAG